MKTYNVKLVFSTNEDQNTIFDLLNKYKDVCNYISKILFKNKHKNFNEKIVHDLCYKKTRKKFPKIPAQVVIKAYKEISANYKSIKSNKHEIDKPVEKNNLSLRLDKRLYSNFTNKSIKITSHIRKNNRMTVEFKLYKKINDMFNKYSTVDPLIFIRDNEIYLSITFDTPELKTKDDTVLGVDLGLRRLITTSDGNVVISKEYLKHKRRMRYNKKQLKKKNTKSSKRKLKKYKRKERNFSKDYTHKLSNKILETDKSIIVLEDLSKIKQKTSKTKEGHKRKKHNNRMGQIPFYMLKEILTYKALHMGKRVETVNPKNTSKNDCRGLKEGVRRGCRYYAVDGSILDADWNASINIANRYSKHPISFKLPIEGKLNLLGRLLCQPTKSRNFSKEKSLTNPML
jgi:IS605 OrfB family transposase